MNWKLLTGTSLILFFLVSLDKHVTVLTADGSIINYHYYGAPLPWYTYSDAGSLEIEINLLLLLLSVISSMILSFLLIYCISLSSKKLMSWLTRYSTMYIVLISIASIPYLSTFIFVREVYPYQFPREVEGDREVRVRPYFGHRSIRWSSNSSDSAPNS